ncbi:Selenocysteine-specific elongation factor [Geodia barretti]|uniref:Selenocysteine-specific elongation factor n=1 Tax=Geodia barretti TaxID=519541 RepID=A0AA35WU72_GEOBA|nr:Selenocysteine-specific elongation factor [Geodia barretti]
MFVVGTAGHVDHGKSTLVEALTGIDPDRLAEEKERGLTIDLGFAWLQLPSGNEVSIVDVPGHERFVNNMLAGIGGIDIALLVVAADESVMPQTREHLAILDLLQIPRGLVALTKKDLVDDEWIELVMADVEGTLEGTALEGAQIMPVSAHTGEGLPELIAAISSMTEDIPAKRDLARPKLPIDRAFTLTGFGTVVTGTLIDGHLQTGQDVELTVAGQRTRDEVWRGEILTNPGWLRPTTAFDVHLRVLEDAPNQLRHNMYVTVHTGSSESVARLRLFEDDRAQPGDTTWAQLKVDSPIAVAKGDYFVIRSNMTTLGGGNIVDTHAPRPRRRHVPTIERLEIMERGSDKDVLLKTIEGIEPAEFRAVVNRANLNEDTARTELQAMIANNQVVILGSGTITQATSFTFALRLSGAKRELRVVRLTLTDSTVDGITRHLAENGEITVADVRDLLGTSRKYALALMDHLDHVRVTRRVGDVRVLR